ncbi:uncharacterized protein LOC144249814 [Urocitellus parryii]
MCARARLPRPPARGGVAEEMLLRGPRDPLQAVRRRSQELKQQVSAVNVRRCLTLAQRRRPRCTPGGRDGGRVESTLQVSVLVAFASGVLLGWQANRLRRRYLDWRKRRLQDKLATTQKKLDLA